MSISISWIASDNIKLPELEQRLGFQRTQSIADECDFAYCSAAVPSTGWNLIMADRVDYVESLDLALISRGARLIALASDDGFMASVVECWCDGKQIWKVLHDGQKGIQHLKHDGDLPEAFAAIHAKCVEDIRSYVPKPPPKNLPSVPPAEAALFAKMGLTIQPFGAATQRVDFHFDIPIKLGASIVGFRHDRRSDDITFHELKAVA